jgi:hypothetical protein
MEVPVFAQDREDEALRVRFCAPAEGEVCEAITLEAMGSPSEELDAYALRGHPDLTCAECVPCQHRFDARALARHFVCHSVTCPLCRCGEAAPMDAGRGPLADEDWPLPPEEKQALWITLTSGTAFRLALILLRLVAESQ